MEIFISKRESDFFLKERKKEREKISLKIASINQQEEEEE